MSISNPYQTYKNNSITTASPGELTLMLYNGCLKAIKQAKDAIGKGSIEKRNSNIQKAQAIIKELMVTLNTEIAISKNLMDLYDYMNRRLIEANINNDISVLNEVEGLVTEFRDTWKQVIHLNRQKEYGTNGGKV
ncbi:flagellar export chaperone FliS [Heyndrickxia sp. FSL K6-6286]|uniref:flagellar export chaperone FliS n=1 Tax=Heyndrickxia sp. FSL K6-6286 TaxID=2921510 RepID=UPI00315A0194